MDNRNAPVSREKKNTLIRFTDFDYSLFLLIIVILIVGLICLFSASHAYANYYNDGDSYYYIRKQSLFALLGLVAMLAISTINYKKIFRILAQPLYAISIVLLVIVLLIPSSTGVHRWIYLPVVGQFQPSELAKFAVILVIALIAEVKYKEMGNIKWFFIGFGLAGAVCLLTVLEPHLSGTMLILGISVVMMYVGGTNKPLLGVCILVGLLGVFIMVFVLGYEHDRIEVWLNPMGVYANDRDQAWQTVQSLFAVGSGGFFGVGLGNSRQKHLFLPEPQNDFIFSVICEELGLVGAILIILLFAVLIIKGLSIAHKTKDRFGYMIAIGITAQIAIQVMLNIAVVTNAIPNTGIGLPFFSYGGTSMLMLLGEMGVLMSVSRFGPYELNK